MGIIMMIGNVFLCILLLFRPMKKIEKEAYHSWGLGVDCCFYYSKPFSLNNNCITITGFQQVLGEGEKIRYSIVKKNWWGKRIVYGHVFISEDFINPNRFQITFNDLPTGLNYQVEVFNGYHMSNGQFKVLVSSEIPIQYPTPANSIPNK